MAKTPSSGAGAASTPTAKVATVAIGIGDWLDVMDSEGVWNVAQIINFPSDKEVEVTYDGWGPEYNEVVQLNSNRVAPFQSYTWAVKCWAKYKKWPWWPSVVTFRSPGTVRGQDHLIQETRMFVDFLDDQDVSKRCRCWIDLSQIKPFDEGFDKHRKKPGDARFEASLARLLSSRASVEFSTLVKGGTLPEEFKFKLADPVKGLRKVVGVSAWIDLLNTNQTRHSQIYAYPDPAAPKNNEKSGGGSVDVDVATGRKGGNMDSGDGKKRKKAGTEGKHAAGSIKRPKADNKLKSDPVAASVETVQGVVQLVTKEVTDSGLSRAPVRDATEVEAELERMRLFSQQVLDKLEDRGRPNPGLSNNLRTRALSTTATGDATSIQEIVL